VRHRSGCRNFPGHEPSGCAQVDGLSLIARRLLHTYFLLQAFETLVLLSPYCGVQKVDTTIGSISMTDQVDGRAPHSVPLWEHENIAKDRITGNPVVTPVQKPGWKRRLDGVLPPYRTYLGMRRKWFLIALAAAIAALLALIIGLSVGLSQNKSSWVDMFMI